MDIVGREGALLTLDVDLPLHGSRRETALRHTAQHRNQTANIHLMPSPLHLPVNVRLLHNRHLDGGAYNLPEPAALIGEVGW